MLSLFPPDPPTSSLDSPHTDTHNSFPPSPAPSFFPSPFQKGNIKLRVFDKVQVGIRVAEGQAAHRDAVLYTLKRPLIPGLEEAAVGGGGKKTGVGAALGKRKGGGSK